MGKQKNNIRMCYISRERFDKKKLLRILIKGDNVILDLSQNMEGRGIYIFPSKENLKKINNIKFLKKTLKKEISKENIIKFQSELNKYMERCDINGKKTNKEKK